MTGIKSYWWKVAGMLLVLFSIYAGTSTKVGPGVAEISPKIIEANQPFTLEVEGYNTSFSNDLNTKAWIKVGKTLISAGQIHVDDHNHLEIAFDGQSYRTDTAFQVAGSLVLEDELHGLFLGPKMVKLNFQTDTVSAADSLVDATERPQKLSQGFFSFPYRYVLYETIRNLNFHVPMWFTMITLLLISFIFSIMHLNSGSELHDIWANAFAKAGLLFGFMGITTGMFWANFTWGTPWTNDPKLNGAAVALLMYLAYQILRNSIDDEDKVSRIAAVYNILAYPIFIVLIVVLPKLANFSMHPGSGDSVGFNTYDLNDNLRKVFYPAVVGWILIGTWVAQLTKRIDKISNQVE